MNIAEIQGAANDAYLKTLGPIDLVPSGHYKAIAAAVAAVAPLLLSEPSEDELDASRISADRLGWGSSARAIIANRLASLTAKPDPAVYEVWQELRSREGFPPSNGDESARLRLKAEKLVAIVDAARAK